MSIQRVRIRTDRFAAVPNEFARDSRLSWKARGLLTYLLSHDVGWNTSLEKLIDQAPDGRDSVRTGLLELKELGYLVTSQKRNEAGQLAEADWLLVDPFTQPSSDEPSSDEPSSDNPSSDNPPPKKTTSKNTKGKNTSARASRGVCASTWTPSEAVLAWAEERNWKGAELRRQIESMVDWAVGKGERKVDWDAALRNWLRRQTPKRRPDTPASHDRSAFSDSGSVYHTGVHDW